MLYGKFSRFSLEIHKKKFIDYCCFFSLERIVLCFMNSKKGARGRLSYTIPILTGFFISGLCLRYLYAQRRSFRGLPPSFMASLIYGGSLELLAVGFLLGPFAPLETLFLAIMIQLRHLFYGIAMLDKFPKKGWKRFLSYLRHVRRKLQY